MAQQIKNMTIELANFGRNPIEKMRGEVIFVDAHLNIHKHRLHTETSNLIPHGGNDKLLIDLEDNIIVEIEHAMHIIFHVYYTDKILKEEFDEIFTWSLDKADRYVESLHTDRNILLGMQ